MDTKVITRFGYFAGPSPRLMTARLGTLIRKSCGIYWRVLELKGI